jgi:photosystem II stability/assembly factor-like uncharacterized protein
MGGDGCVFKTTDFGATWEISKIGAPSTYLNKVSFANDSIGMAVGYASQVSLFGAIYKTKDGGKTWTGTFGGSFGVHLKPDGSGAITGGAGGFVKTSDFGQTFQSSLGANPNVGVRTIWVQNDSSYVVGGGNVINNGIYRTTNTGRTWTYSAGGAIKDLYFPSDSVGYGVGLNGATMKTKDGGKIWVNLTQITNNDLDRVYFLNDTVGYKLGAGCYKTVNGGKTWTGLPISAACAMHFYSRDSGYVLTTRGYLLKSTDGGNTWRNFLIWGGNETFNDAAFLKDRIVSVGISGDVHTTFLNCNYVATLFPTIIRSGKTLHANYATGNQWFRDSVAIVGATSNTFTPTVSGNYYVVHTNNSGCRTKPSSKISVVINSNSAIVETPLKVYPNPTNAQITVDIPTELGNETLHVFNTLGQIVFTQKVNNAAVVTLDVSPFATGFHLIRIGNKTAKVMKQ